jgi:hypothetical protein
VTDEVVRLAERREHRYDIPSRAMGVGREWTSSVARCRRGHR